MKYERFKLEIELGNDAMRTRADVIRALRRLATAIEMTSKVDEAKILDINGNSVGRWSFE